MQRQMIEEIEKIKANTKKWHSITDSNVSFWNNVKQNKNMTDAQRKLSEIRDYMNLVLVERSVEIDYILAALIAKQSGFLFGVPGTAKSMTISTLAGCFEGMNYFQYLIHQSTTPEDVFGPISIKALKEDKLRYNTEGFLPSSQVAFLDEIFKGNAGLLNGLLTIINERKFHNGGQTEMTPLESVFCASNEIPEDPSLRALYDRLVFRIKVDPVSHGNLEKVLRLTTGETKLPPPPKLTLEDLRQMRIEAEALQFPDHTYKQVVLIDEKIKTTFGGELAISARRLGMILKLMRGFSYLLGFSDVSANIIPMLYNCLWDRPDQIEQCKQMLFSSRSAEMTFLMENYNQCLAAFAKYQSAYNEYKRDSRTSNGAALASTLNGMGTMLNEFILMCYVSQEQDKNLVNDLKYQEMVRNIFDGIYHSRDQRDRLKAGNDLSTPHHIPTI